MNNVDDKIKNVYYMLCYVFRSETLEKKNESILETETFDNIYNLFAEILYILVKKQLKQGLMKEYINLEEEMRLVKGKINLTKTINKNVKSVVVCEYDDYNVNSYVNRIIKASIFWLIKSNKIGVNMKSKLKKILLYFSDVELMEPKSIRWDQIKYNRNNLSYKFIIHLCYLILNKLLVSNTAGKYSFNEFLDDQSMNDLYERFVREYYKKHFKQFKTSAKKSRWDDIAGYSNDYLPELRTDITLEYDDRMLIIDTKFYSEVLRSGYMSNSRVVSRDNFNQIFVYVDRQDPQKTGRVLGMLLYAQTVNEGPINFITNVGHIIVIQTLDMNSEWGEIDHSLKELGIKFINNDFIQNEVDA